MGRLQIILLCGSDEGACGKVESFQHCKETPSGVPGNTRLHLERK